MFVLNATIASLVLSSLSRAPLFQTSFTTARSDFRLESSRFHRFTSHLFYSNALHGRAAFARSTVTSFLSSPIHIDGHQLLRYDVQGQHTDLSQYSELLVTEMTFADCTTEHDGGAIYATADTYVFCNFSSFSNCSAGNKGGAFFALVPHLNFTQGCFNNCAAKRGTAVFAGYSEKNISFEGCYIDGAEDDSADSAIYAYTRDLVMKGSNISYVNIAANAAFSVQTTHWLNISDMTFYNLSSNKYITSFQGAEPNTPFESSNFIACKTPGSEIIYINGYSMEYRDVVFYQCTCEKYFAIGSDVLKVRLVNTSFDDIDESKIADDTSKFVLNNTVFKQLEPNETIDLDAVITKGCWGHSHYIWESPKTLVQVVVGVIIALCLIVGLILIFMCTSRK